MLTREEQRGHDDETVAGGRPFADVSVGIAVALVMTVVARIGV
jgi:hypothetical protein